MMIDDKTGALFRYSIVVEIPYAPNYEKVHDVIATALVESLRGLGVNIVVVNGNDCVSIEDMGRVN